MQESISPPVQHHRRDLLQQASSDEVSHLLLQASSEEVAHGEWWVSFAIFTDDGEKSPLYWMPSHSRLSTRQSTLPKGLDYGLLNRALGFGIGGTGPSPAERATIPRGTRMSVEPMMHARARTLASETVR
jgi:hypothetical protein